MNRMMRRRAVARMLGVSASTLKEWNRCGVGPLSGRWGLYDRREVTTWAEEARIASEVDDVHI